MQASDDTPSEFIAIHFDTQSSMGEANSHPHHQTQTHTHTQKYIYV